MDTLPITGAVYGRSTAGRKRRPGAPARRPHRGTQSVADALGQPAVGDLYRALGFKPPGQRRRRKRGQRR